LPRKYLKYHLVWYSGFSRIGVLGDPNICSKRETVVSTAMRVFLRAQVAYRLL
jgi:hypothetical protein